MLRKISILLSFALIILFFGIESYAIDEDKFEFENPYDGFSVLTGNMDISNDLIYAIRYSVKDSTDDIINGEIIYQYEISGDSNYNGSVNVIYKIENSLGIELKVTIGSSVIYDLVLDSYASIYECNIYDFTDFTDKLLYIGDFSYTESYYSADSNAIALLFHERTKLEFLLGINAKKGIDKNITISNIDAKDINEIYANTKKEYGVVLDYKILESNYSPISNNIEAGKYNIKILAKNENDELYIDKINIEAVENENYFYCEDIKVNYDEPISDELIYKYYVHYYKKENIILYKIESNYRFTVNKDGIYEYKVTLIDNNENELTFTANIEVGDFKKPSLNVRTKNIGNGSYLSINDKFEFSAYDNKDLDITSKINVFDIDDYEHNYNKSGNYRFLFSVSDNALNETVKLIEYTVNNLNEEIEEEPTNNPNENNNEEKPNEEKEEMKKPEVIKYDFYTDNETPLTREMIRQKLIFSGFYKESDNFSMTSEYFENKDKNGTYLIYVHFNDNVDCYSITVKDKEVKLDVNDDEQGFDYRFILIGGIIVGVLAIGIGFFVIKKVKNKK